MLWKNIGMKNILILIFIAGAFRAFSQDSIPRVRQIADSPLHHFPFAINAVAPLRNYFTGGQYLFEKWVRGSLIMANNESFDDSQYFFNYNKVTRNLLLTNDFKGITEIDNREVRAFSLVDGHDIYRFEHVFLLDDHRFFQVLVKTGNYSLYKYTATQFRHTEMNRNPGEFVDSYFYYVIFPGGKMFKEVSLRKRSILKNCLMDADKVSNYFTMHSQEGIDENFLIGLIKYLNN